MSQTIRLLINRKWEEIPLSEIIYISIFDKLSYFHLKTKEHFNLFITLSELEQLLPEERFIRVSRNCIVAFDSIYSINANHIQLLNGETLPYSKRREKHLLESYKQYLGQKLSPSHLPNNDVQIRKMCREYQIFNTIPLAFTIIELVEDKKGNSMDFIFRYANDPFALLQGFPLEQIIGNSFFSLFSNANTKWIELFADVAFNNNFREITDYSPELHKFLRLQCFQPMYGFCACIVTDVSTDSKQRASYQLSKKDPQKLQRFFQQLEHLTDSQLNALITFINNMN
ncbi:MAG: LytR/AlgR family response regulator transcription factor [Blautia sp.]|jgi:hypothetical protein